LITESEVKDIFALLESASADIDHACQVAKLSNVLFSELSALHKLGEDELRLLYYSSMLHDIGILVSEKGHHKNSYDLIMSDKTLGLTDEERSVVANTARYHRKAGPKASHNEFMDLSAEERHIVEVLSAILRIADGLDRTHMSLIYRLSCRISDKYVWIRCYSDYHSRFDEEAALKKSDLFENIFCHKVVIEWETG
jgi:exopolyphosphatase/guanosine-5'-triphosphate,3'-diphosphate pyrophosphatase